MTVVGDDLIQNCRDCFAQRGYGIRLQRSPTPANRWKCPHCGANYEITNGCLIKLK
ncbi:MAG: hypothetical protein QW343_03860 [Candidatus Norongarragalinales archaeon]